MATTGWRCEGGADVDLHADKLLIEERLLDHVCGLKAVGREMVLARTPRLKVHLGEILELQVADPVVRFRETATVMRERGRHEYSPI
jgi:hypothetical protein